MPHARVRNDDVFGPATSRGEGGSVPVLNSSIFLWTWAKARRPRKVAFSRLQRRCWWLPHIQTSSCAWSTFFAGCWGRHRKHCLLMAARLPLLGKGWVLFCYLLEVSGSPSQSSSIFWALGRHLHYSWSFHWDPGHWRNLAKILGLAFLSRAWIPVSV